MASHGEGGKSANADAEARLKALVTPPRFSVEDEHPGIFAPSILVGSARHAFGVDRLLAKGVTAVLNLAPKACADMSSRYAESGIEYLALDAEDEEGFALVDRYLEAACSFLTAVDARGGVALVHCFAGVNRSAAIAIAYLMLSQQRPLEQVVQQCFTSRPFILTNASFRAQLVALALRRGLLLDAPAPSASGHAAAASEPPPGLASSTAPLELGEVLGEGAFASVYRCRLPDAIGRPAHEVAAKVVSTTKAWIWVSGKRVPAVRALDSLRAEATALRQLHERGACHPRIVEYLGFVSESARALLLLELVPGGDLENLANAHPDGLDDATVHPIGADLLGALEFCHFRGIAQ